MEYYGISEFAKFRRLTEEEFKILEEYKPRFVTAIECDYIRAIWKEDVDKLQAVCKAVTGKKLNICEWCGVGKLELMRYMGRMYFSNLLYERTVKNKKRMTKEEEDEYKKEKKRRQRNEADKRYKAKIRKQNREKNGKHNTEEGDIGCGVEGQS